MRKPEGMIGASSEKDASIGANISSAHARIIRSRTLDCHSETGVDDAPHQVDRGAQQNQADVIELNFVREIDRRDELAAFLDRQAVITAVTREPGDDVISHLRKRQRNHDEIDTACAQAERSDHERKERGHQKRDGPLHEACRDPFKGEHVVLAERNAGLERVIEAECHGLGHSRL